MARIAATFLALLSFATSACSSDAESRGEFIAAAELCKAALAVKPADASPIMTAGWSLKSSVSTSGRVIKINGIRLFEKNDFRLILGPTPTQGCYVSATLSTVGNLDEVHEDFVRKFGPPSGSFQGIFGWANKTKTMMMKISQIETVRGDEIQVAVERIDLKKLSELLRQAREMRKKSAEEAKSEHTRR